MVAPQEISDVQRVVQVFARRLASLEAEQAQQMIVAYEPIQGNLDMEILKLVRLTQQRHMTRAQFLESKILGKLRTQMIGDLSTYYGVVNSLLQGGKARAVALSQQSTFATMSAGLPPGITTNLLSEIGLTWNRLPREAFANFVALSQSGAPVANLLAPLGPEAATAVTETIGEGIMRGYGPRKTAMLAQKASGMQLSKVLTISRTETLRAYREATRLNYAANPDVVKGYRRLSARDETTCMACIALDGTLYETNEPLDAHPNCRCTMVPETLTYEDLGLDIPEEARPPSGPDWFNGLSKNDQEGMMGPKIFAAHQQGKVELSDLVTTSTSTVWGKSSTVKSLKALGL